MRLPAILSVILVCGSFPVGAIDFSHEVVPILRKHCGQCHTGDAKQGGYSLNSREATLAGGDSGTPGFVAGDASASEIIARITSDDPDTRMPSDGPPLPAEAIAVLRRWIDEQAPWEEGFTFKGTAWEPPLQLRTVQLPAAEGGRTNPVDRVVDAYWRERGVPRPPQSDDRTFIRRASLDITGLLPDPERVERFVADASPGKRAALVDELLGDDLAYAEHWMTFWNDLLRNDYAGTGFITGGRRQITTWLHRSLVDNKPFDAFVRELIAPTEESRGFIDGIVWRGEVNASQTVPIQFAQNVGQTFLGINLKCASCHDSFVDRWTLQQTYDLAAISSEQVLELARCDKLTGAKATPRWLFTDLGQVDSSLPPSKRLEQLAALMTKPENGWLSRCLVNRLWHRLVGRGLVHPVDSLRTKPWSEDLLEVLAGDLVASGWDVKHVLRTICTSETYGAVTPAVEGQPQGSDYVFRGPLPRRMTAEQFSDAVWQLTSTSPAKPDAEVRRLPSDGSSPTGGPSAVWIWSNDLADSPPGEKLAFRRTFDLPADVVHAAAVVTADNEATLVVNGRRAATTTEWTQPLLEVISTDLQKGENEIVVVAANAAAGGPAAMRAEVRCLLADGSRTTIATDGSWQWTRALPDGKGRFSRTAKWGPAAVIKTQGVWASGDAAFAAQAVAASSASGKAPMVRAVLVKGTPFMAALGRPNREQVVTSRPSDLTTLEAIQLANDQSLADEFTKGGGRLLEKHGASPTKLLEWMFAAALSRPPTDDETVAIGAMLGNTPTDERVADCLWAIVMLPEFQLVR